MAEHAATNPKVPGLIPAWPHTDMMAYDEASFMHFSPGVVHNFKGNGCIGFLSVMHKTITDWYLKRLSSQ